MKTALPSAEDTARARHELSTLLLAATEEMTPIFDAADGMRADMENRGWSPTAAEAVALVWLQGMMAKMTRE